MRKEPEVSSQNQRPERTQVSIPIPLTGEATIVGARTPKDAISQLVKVETEQSEDGAHKVHVGFTLWEDSGGSKGIAEQLFVGHNETDFPTCIYDPHKSYLIFTSDEKLQEYTKGEGYFEQVAKFIGQSIALTELKLDEKQVAESEVKSTGLEELSEKVKPGFGIDKKVDTLVGYLTFEVTFGDIQAA